MTELIQNLATSWAQTYQRLQAELDQARAHPAFFKPEYVEALDNDLADALRWYRFWLTQD